MRISAFNSYENVTTALACIAAFVDSARTGCDHLFTHMNKPTSKLILIAALSAVLVVGVVLAKTAAPAINVSARKHPNIEAAQKFCMQAYDKITAAQKANEYDLAGHAARAKDLIEQANSELKLSAEASNENK